jgi:ABC-type lipopolysaccharide export system ATPase subunit
MLRFAFEDGGSVVVEAADNDIGVAQVSRPGDNVAAAERTFEAALGSVRQAAEAVLLQFQALASRPDEVSIEFGVSFNAQAGAIIAKTGVDSHLNVTLAWRKAQLAAATIVEQDQATQATVSGGAED